MGQERAARRAPHHLRHPPNSPGYSNNAHPNYQALWPRIISASTSRCFCRHQSPRAYSFSVSEAIDDYVGLDNSVGFIDAFGFLSAYILVSLAAPAYLRKLKQLDKRAPRVSVLAVSFMILAFFGVVGVPGSELFPPPKFPNNLLVWVFVAVARQRRLSRDNLDDEPLSSNPWCRAFGARPTTSASRSSLTSLAQRVSVIIDPSRSET